ncbi:3-hydroxyasparagine phosphotransferase [Cryptosporangium sp. NPDC051539]|uniref:3-hydroxyasparagine phosphotransferase n=1 Tax=Cryptosporangium sp. NPDC051539 TaxID=3363962 RepID=UPI0037A898E6
MLFTDTDPVSDDALLGLVYEVCPRFVPGTVLHRSSTSFVVAGSVDLSPVVAKVQAGGSPFWREHFLREVEAYRVFETSPPPVRTARLLSADTGRGVLLLERVFGRPLAYDRHPSVAIPADELAGALTELRQLAKWQPPVGQSWIVNYTPRIDRARRQGMFDDADRAAVAELARRAAGRWELAHGDLVLDNVLKTREGYVFLDWATVGLYLAGFDLAQLWVLLGDLHGPRRVIEDLVNDDGPPALAPFLVNLALLLGRERRAYQHRTDADGVTRRMRLAEAWDDVRQRVHRAVRDE